MEDIIGALDSIWYSTINSVNVDMLNKTVTFELTLVDNGETTDHELKFVNCRAFLWLESDKYTDEAYDLSKCNYYELTSVDIRKISTVSDDKWLKSYPMEYNVAIEIWETALLINADKLILDNKEFAIP